MKITAEWLKEKNACAEGYKWFLSKFGESGSEYQSVLDELAKENRAYWASWLMLQAGPTKDVLEVQGDLIVEHSIFFSGFIKVTGKIISKFLFSGWGIEAGEGIEAGWGIEAGSGIEAGEGIEAGSGIEAGEGIEAGSGIEAGWGIEAGEGIEAGDDFGIYAGLTVRISRKTQYAIVSAKEKPVNLICGEWQEKK